MTSPSKGEGEVALIALGSNLGDRYAHLASARAAIAARQDTTLVAESDIEETDPIGFTDQPLFLNQMIAVRTTAEPIVLLEGLLEIERAQGRVRTARWGPRTIDLDIVRFGDRHIATSALTVPHPEIGQRPFWQREIDQLRDRMLQQGMPAPGGPSTESVMPAGRGDASVARSSHARR